MKEIIFKNSDIKSNPISLGCMRMANLSVQDAANVINTAFESGINFYDHADIYGKGLSEGIFSKALAEIKLPREKIYLQSKCGITNGMYDFSKEHILSSVDGILKRLNTDYLDVLLLHRPDSLMEPEEVAEAFDTLKSNGKVRYFGVSNQNSMQIELLSRYLNQDIIANQLQFSIMHTNMIDNGINVNMINDGAIDRDGLILEYCRLKDITIQAWSPFQYGFFEGVFLDNDKFPELNATINEIASNYSVTNSAIAIAWILRHPANMQAVIGTMNSNRIKDISKANDITLTKKEWYDIYKAAGNKLP